MTHARRNRRIDGVPTLVQATILTLVLGPPILAQAAHVVAGDGSADFTQLQDAITAAANGDVILVRPHTERYEATVVAGKSLTIVGEGDVHPRVEDFTIRDLNPGRDVSLRFLDIEGRSEPHPFVGALQRPGVTLENDQGCVWLEDLVVAGGDGIVKLGGFEEGHPGLRIADSECVVAVDCTFEGGDGKWSVGGTSYRGEDGADLTNSHVALHGCTLVGGAGGDTGDEALFPTPDPSASGLVARDASTVKHLATSFAEGGGPATPGAPLSVEGGSSAEGRGADALHAGVGVGADAGIEGRAAPGRNGGGGGAGAGGRPGRHAGRRVPGARAAGRHRGHHGPRATGRGRASRVAAARGAVDGADRGRDDRRTVRATGR
jgi:hypothetical protein